jgi:hypothetical protein
VAQKILSLRELSPDSMAFAIFSLAPTGLTGYRPHGPTQVRKTFSAFTFFSEAADSDSFSPASDHSVAQAELLQVAGRATATCTWLVMAMMTISGRLVL